MGVYIPGTVLDNPYENDFSHEEMIELWKDKSIPVSHILGIDPSAPIEAGYRWGVRESQSLGRAGSPSKRYQNSYLRSIMDSKKR